MAYLRNSNLGKLQYINYKAPATDLYNGTATGGSLTTLVDTNANWEVDQWKDKVVKIQRNGGSDFEFDNVLSNTSNTITFDSDLLYAPSAGNSYRILNTLQLSQSQLDTMIDLDIEDNCCAVLLPPSTLDIERKYAHVYVERAVDGTHIAPIVCYGTDVQNGVKYGTLEHRYEGVRLHAHTCNIPHWDIIQTYGVDRFATGYWNANEAIASTTWAYLGNMTALTYDNKKRFVEYDRSGKKWIRYTSLVPQSFSVKLNVRVSKTGAGGEASFSVAKRDGTTGVVTNLDSRLVSTLFGGGDGVATVTLTVPVTLSRNDEIIAIARRNTGTFSVLAGSQIEVIIY